MNYALNIDNMKFELEKYTTKAPNVIYCDCIYENDNFDWLDKYFQYLPYNDGVLIIQTDWHTNYMYRYLLEHEIGAYCINDVVWKNEWGNHPKDRFHQCYDNILIYSRNEHHYFNSDVIQVPKATVNTKLNPSGRQTKTATAWIDDICLTTTSKERVKKPDGHLVRWQKPMKLYDRIIAPFLPNPNNALILDPFMGSGSLGKWCAINLVHYIGMEIDPEVYSLACTNIQSGEFNE